ncbi:HEPN domain-containing protein [Stygiolobus caldivivus]|uniref:HEPN domain-containing protein n=1 Tax=Stygiolobus caldivivus TaxID=2824673 RepID=A0A8D5U5B7_9CREN|nr:HEPN domain-containing protein [Stygiolobus caldivivus]BCU69537.1 hypothetical protein KN1_08340 [Stygiolobus caldivivus]
MNNSALASEFMTRAFRSLNNAKTSYEEGDLTDAISYLYSVVELLSAALLGLYGFYTPCEHKAQMLNVIVSKVNEKEIALIRKLQLLEQRLYPTLLVDESSLKEGSVVARNVETKNLVKEVEDLFELANKVFDEFHS